MMTEDAEVISIYYGEKTHQKKKQRNLLLLWKSFILTAR